jgi:hypothetical protein
MCSGRREGLQHLLADGTVTRADIQHLEPRIVRQRRERQHPLQEGPPLRIARSIPLSLPRSVGWQNQ